VPVAGRCGKVERVDPERLRREGIAESLCYGWSKAIRLEGDKGPARRFDRVLARDSRNSSPIDLTHEIPEVRGQYVNDVVRQRLAANGECAAAFKRISVADLTAGSGNRSARSGCASAGTGMPVALRGDGD